MKEIDKIIEALRCRVDEDLPCNIDCKYREIVEEGERYKELKE